MDVAERHPQVVAGGREVAAAQLLVDRHQVEVGFSPGFIELHISVGAVGTQHALDQFCHHGKPERIGPPARSFDGILESRLGEKHLGIMSGAGAGVLINAFLHQEGGCWSMKSASARASRPAGGGGTAQKASMVPPESAAFREPERGGGRIGILVRKSYKAARPCNGTFKV